MGKYRYGYLPSPPDKVGLGHPTALLAAAPSVPSAAVPLGPTVDQGNAGACVGNSVAVAVQDAGATEGLVASSAAMAIALAATIDFGELPSRRYVYGMARLKAGQVDSKGRLPDDGTYIHSAFEAMAEVGYPPESAMPYTDDPVGITEQPPFEALREAIAQAPTMVTGAHRITSTGAQRVADVKAAIAAGHPVVWGTDLDQAFEDLPFGASGVWPGVTGSVIGGHAMVLWAYEPWQSGKSKFASRSSWTADFADDGSAWVSESAIASSHASDFWIVLVAKKLGGTRAAENAS